MKLKLKLKYIPSNVFLVGGSVRDFLLKKSINDYDFVLKTDEEKFIFEASTFIKRNFNKKGFLIGKFYPPTMRTVLRGKEVIDITLMAGDFEQDALRRDFTVNSLYLNLHNEAIIDPLEGKESIRSKKIKLSSDNAFVDDPLRMLRAVRLMGQLENFTLEKRTYEKMVFHKKLIKNVAVERIREELEKIFLSDERYVLIKHLQKTGILFEIFPELILIKDLPQKEVHKYDVLNHSINILKFIPSDTDEYGKKIYSYVALFHDIGKYDTSYRHSEFSVRYAKSILSRLKFPKKETKLILQLIENHMRILQISLNNVKENTLKKLVFNYYDILDFLICFVLMESNTKNKSNEELFKICNKLKLLKEDFLKKKKGIDTLVTGKDLIELGIEGEKIGKLLEKIKFIIYRDNISSKEEALKLLKGVI